MFVPGLVCCVHSLYLVFLFHWLQDTEQGEWSSSSANEEHWTKSCSQVDYTLANTIDEMYCNSFHLLQRAVFIAASVLTRLTRFLHKLFQTSNSLFFHLHAYISFLHQLLLYYTNV